MRPLRSLRFPALLLAGCGSGSGRGAADAACAPSGDDTFDVGTGESAFVAVETLDGVPLVEGPQGGFHVWIALRARGLGPRVAVDFGVRDARSGASLSIEGLGLPALDLEERCGAYEFAGLTAFLSLFDAGAYVGRRALLWASVTDDAGAASDEAETVLLEPE